MFFTVMCVVYPYYVSIDYCPIVISWFMYRLQVCVSLFHSLLRCSYMYCLLSLFLYENPNSHRTFHRQNVPPPKTPSSFNLAKIVVNMGYCWCV